MNGFISLASVYIYNHIHVVVPQFDSIFSIFNLIPKLFSQIWWSCFGEGDLVYIWRKCFVGMENMGCLSMMSHIFLHQGRFSHNLDVLKCQSCHFMWLLSCYLCHVTSVMLFILWNYNAWLVNPLKLMFSFSMICESHSLIVCILIHDRMEWFS